MVVLSPGSAHQRPSTGPSLTLAEIFQQAFLQSGLQTSQKGKRNITAQHQCRAVIFRCRRLYSFLPKKNLKIDPSGAGRGPNQKNVFFFRIFVYIIQGGHAKFQNPTTCPSLVLVTVACQENKRKIVAYGCQIPSAQRRTDQQWLTTVCTATFGPIIYKRQDKISTVFPQMYCSNS